MTLVPNSQGQTPRMSQLIRVSSYALGVGRPMSDLMLAPSARLYHRSPTLERVTGHSAAFVPAADFVDGVNIIPIALQTAVAVFQLGFARHERIVANGVEIDSQNTGARHELGLRGNMLAYYMDLFLHMVHIEDFGMLMHPRVSMHDLNFVVVA
jgi:hypothetical protein